MPYDKIIAERAALREEFIARAITLAKQYAPDFYTSWDMSMNQYVALARLKVGQCDEKIPLDFQMMKEHARDADILHDFFGIMRHWNVVSERMEDCFMPRCAK